MLKEAVQEPQDYPGHQWDLPPKLWGKFLLVTVSVKLHMGYQDAGSSCTLIWAAYLNPEELHSPGKLQRVRFVHGAAEIPIHKVTLAVGVMLMRRWGWTRTLGWM